MSTVATSPEKRSFPVVSPSGHCGQQNSASSTPNQHPYAIKTTSTGILTRSNSTKSSTPHHHVYIPSSPTPVSKHRHSKSDLSRPSPRPLPIPPSLESPTKYRKGHGYTSSDELIFPSVRARADTLPNTSSPSMPSPTKVDELPSNPRVWTTSQLASYLITALRVRSGEALPLPLPVAKDIAAFVKEARLNGRSFLRLNEQDLESMGINNLWREALLNASRNLRQNVLKGRIWGFEEDDITGPTRVLPYRSLYNSSSSSIDETLDSQESTPHKSNIRNGRVRGLVASLERTSSSGSGFSNHGSSTSEGDVIPGAWVDEEASFASGSEASEAEDRKARAVTKKRLLPQLPAPTVGASQAVDVSSPVTAASPEEEPSVEDLLASDCMSGSWGAKAWEEMNIGETVKHVGDASAGTHNDVFGRPDSVPKSSIEKHNDGRKDNTLPQVKEIFLHPLPLRPLPSLLKSEVASPIISASPVRIVAKLDKNIQVNTEPSELVGVQDTARSTDLDLPDDSERLREALSLLDDYRQQIAELEEKVRFLERKGAEQAQVERRSQGTETDDIAPSSVPPGTDSAESRTFISEDVDTGTSVAAATNSADVEPRCGVGSTKGSQHSSTSAENSDHSASPCSIVRLERREFFDSHGWDPLENGLSSYVLMVSFGVCAVVLSTILKRLAGKKS